MENSAVRLPEQTTMSGAGTSATAGETSSFHTALEECLPAGHAIALGNRSGAGSSMEQKSEYFSACVEFEIEHSKVHWSEVPGLSEVSEDNDHEDEEVTRKNREVTRENREVFAELKNDPQWRHREGRSFFINCPPEMKLGRKIAEGGQAEIFEITDEDGNVDNRMIFKVFKRGSRLSHLQEQWEQGILQWKVPECITFKGTILDDGRFAFVMMRCQGDLRKLIVQAMEERNNQGPPFPYEWNGETLDVTYILLSIALNMQTLHEKGIIHRDLKAANILLMKEADRGSCTFPAVADYECSIGVYGTGFWRAPEILRALKEKRKPDFTKKADVYSFGMICFEVVTGRLPFEGEFEDCKESRDLVIAGQRPTLPSDLDVSLKDLIERCWNSTPNERPSFQEISQTLR